MTISAADPVLTVLAVSDLRADRVRAALVQAVLALVLLSLAACNGHDAVQLEGRVMGTSWHVTVVPAGAPLDAEQLQHEVQTRLDRIDGLMSTWKSDSELSQVNRGPINAWLSLSPDTLATLNVAREAWELTDGAFDVTVAPLVDLWGFGPAEYVDAGPDADALEEALGRVGFAAIELRAEPPALRKSAARQLDLSAVAKGYAVDVVAEYLSAERPAGFLVEVGGELRTGGRNPAGHPWLVGIETPELAGGSPAEAIQLGDAGVATSGDYRNFRVIDGRRVAHTIDPRTGRPVEHGLASVTVVAQSSAWADALATGLTVLGGDAALALAEREGLAVYLIEHDGQHFRARPSTAFRQYLR